MRDRYAIPRRWALSAVLACVGLTQAARAQDAKSPGNEASATTPARFALLVGCTKYVNNPKIRELRGPHNDVALIARLLATRFAFQPSHIQTLSGWPADIERRPSSANIAAAFETLIAKATPGSQIVIHLSGHGAQAPIPQSQTDPRDARNPEPDGLDELFLPADVGTWTRGEVAGAIRDDQIGAWLSAMRAKGAHVWIIFDCCHSGTMVRGAEDAEVPRSVDPAALGVPESQFDRAPATLPTDSAVDSLVIERPVPGAGEQGSVVAFYAAQAFEEAPDLPRPASAAKRPENYFGLLTYTLGQVLEQQGTALDYRQLGCLIASRYRAERGSRSPTPLCEGDLDQPVLGSRRFAPAAPIMFQRRDSELTLDAGELQGVTPGSTLAVLKRVDGTTERDILGYVRVQEATAFSATVAPCAFRGLAAAPPATWPEFAPCRLVVRDIGSLRLKLAVIGSEEPGLASCARMIRETLDQLPEETGALFTLVEDTAAADYELRLVSASEAREAFGLEFDLPSLLLLPGGLAKAARLVSREQATPRAGDAPLQAGALRTIVGRPLARFDVQNAKALAADLERDVRKVFAWRNLWRIVGNPAGKLEPRRSGLKLEIASIANEDDTSGGQLLDATQVPGGQSLEVRVRNDDLEDYWVTLLFVGADFSIDVWYSDSIRQGATFPPLRSTVDDASTGPEGFILLAQAVSRTPSRPRLDLLVQAPLGQADGGRTRDVPSDPFAAFLTAATAGVATRGTEIGSAANWEILSWSWVTVPRRPAVNLSK